MKLPSIIKATDPVFNNCLFFLYVGFSGGSVSKVSAYNAGDPASIPGWEDALEKGMATHSSILPWKIPRTEEAGGLQLRSMGLQEVGHD